MSEFVIETQHLYKRFGQVTALEDINIQGVFKLKDTGYPVFRFAKDVIVNNNEVIEEQDLPAGRRP